MIIYTEEFKQGYNSIIDLGSSGARVMMDVGILKLPKGAAFELEEKDKETAWLLLTGAVEFQSGGKAYVGERNSLFDKMPSCLHVPKCVKVRIKAREDSEIYVQKTINAGTFTPRFYASDDVQCTEAGLDDQLGGCMRRNIRTVFDFENAPYSNMVLGEVVNFPGKWSSYPPHFHPQPEVYFYKFDRPQGFGASFVGDHAFMIRHNSLTLISDGVVHPQTAAPGYAMFYVWGIRHLEGDPWRKTRTDAPEHTWMLEKDAKIWAGK